MQTPLSPPPLARLLTCALMLLVTACGGEPAGSPPAAVQQEQRVGAQPYYLYEGKPVYLEVDPTRLTVSGPEALTEPELHASLSRAGLKEARVERMPLQSRSFTVRLASGTPAHEAQRLAEALRREGRHEFVANAYRGKEDGGEVTLHNRLVVHLKEEAGDGAIDRLARELGMRVLHGPLGGAPEYVLTYPRGVDPLAFALEVGQRPEVEWVDPDKTSPRQLHAVPTDPDFALQYYARNAATFNGVRVDVNAEWAWDLTYGAWSAAAGPLVVAVIDSGVDVSHPDLDSSSVLGYDAVTNSWGSWGCTDCAVNPFGNDSHGTFVAGIIKAQHNNGIGLAGLAPAVKLLPIRISRGGFFAPDSQIAMAIDAAWQNDAQVISNSWGVAYPSNAITSAINRATTQGRGGRGSVVVFAAGNPSERSTGSIGGVSYPATLPNVLAVGAINRNGTLTDYSPEGPELDIVAPSGHITGNCIGDIVTADLMGWRGCNDGPGGNIDYSSTFSGTSAAAPQVAAVAAMVISRSPTLTEANVRSQITAGADPWGWGNQFGAGKLNAYRALVGRVRVSILGTSSPPTPGTYTYTASVSGGMGSNSYYWTLTRNGSTQYIGSGPSVSPYVSEGYDFTLQVRVTNGPDRQTATMTRFVRGPVSCLTYNREGPGIVPPPPDCLR